MRLTALTPREVRRRNWAADLIGLYEACADRSYGEDVTVLSHSLQTAGLARADGATDALVAAALLHDVGHLLATEEEVDRSHPDEGDDDHHEAIGARLVAATLGPEVALPVALHVQAKRWRCTVEPEYRSRLSAQSALTLEAQGGLLDAEECRRFEDHPGFAQAVELRRWDDRAKLIGAKVPSMDSYRSLLGSLVAARAVGTPKEMAEGGRRAADQA